MSQTPSVTPSLPRLSIVIPCYNAQATLLRTLASLPRITLAHRPSVQIILINDGSHDDTALIIDRFVGSSGAFSALGIHQANAGVSVARNTGIARATGEWLMFLDSDDELGVDPLLFLEAGPNSTEQSACTAHAFATEFHRDGRRIGGMPAPRLSRARHLDDFTAGNPVTISTLVFRRTAMSQPFATDVRALEDWLFWIENPGLLDRVITHAGVVSSIVHVHASNRSGDYANVGRHREMVAQRVLSKWGQQLTGRQRNNLHIQAQIGRLLQRQPFQWSALSRLPASLPLYGKLWVYALLGRWWGRLDRYRR